jgi:choice-of-anchor C domain-containing protein
MIAATMQLSREGPMRLLAAGLSLTLVLPIGTAAPAPANLLVNGSFEDGPDDIGEYKSLDKGADAIKGWKVTRGQIDLIGTFWTSAHGSRSLDLHGSPGYGGVEQTFKTKKGTKYKVELQLAATPESGDRSVWVAAAGDKKQFEVNSGDGTREKMKWMKVSWEFTAAGDETTLEVYTTEKGDDFRGPAIDEVTVSEK